MIAITPRRRRLRLITKLQARVDEALRDVEAAWITDRDVYDDPPTKDVTHNDDAKSS